MTKDEVKKAILTGKKDVVRIALLAYWQKKRIEDKGGWQEPLGLRPEGSGPLPIKQNIIQDSFIQGLEQDKYERFKQELLEGNIIGNI